MGETRAELERSDPQSTRGGIQDLIERVKDHLTRKKNDLGTEKGQEARNQASITKLETAEYHLRKALEALESY